MLSALFILAIGIIIGWNWPQPPWARDIQDKVVTWVRSLFSK
ncbi:hypothetical protein ABC977_03295 [Thioalkalicoccus limnaeus]|uniref:Uncharacterized protein n=1 Tax=Thioalkalicoccus limnaeus TaxID=120681 RepID=A0ABV4BAG6_9GAMM